MRCIPILAVVASLSLVSVEASAQTRGEHAMRWRAPVSCPSEKAVRAKLDELVRAKVGSRHKAVEWRGVVERTPDGYRLTLVVEQEGAVTERRIDGASCAVLADAATVILAYAIDPTLALAEPVKPDEPRGDESPSEPSGRALSGASEPSPEPEPVAPEPPVVVSETPPPVASPVAPVLAEPPSVVAPLRAEVFASLGGGAGAGPLPSPVPIATAAFGVRYGVHRVALEGRYWARAQATSSGDSSAGGSIGLGSAALAYGALFPVADGVRLGPVGGLELGAIYGTGAGDIAARSSTGLWAAATAGGFADFAISPRWGFHTAVTGFVPFTRPTFIIDTTDTVYRPAPVGARIEAALEVTF